MQHFLESGMTWKLINFFLFLFLIVYFVRRPLSQFWQQRREGLRAQIEEARRLHEEAEARHQQLKARVNQLEQEVVALQGRLHHEGTMEKQRLVQQAEEYAARLKADTAKILTQELKRAQEQLRAETVNLALELSDKTLRKQIQETDQQRLNDATLKMMEGHWS